MKNSLTKEQIDILKHKGTEKAFTGKLLYNKEEGIYKCVGCGNKLFSSDEKYDSGSGWPSFSDIYSKESIKTKIDISFGMIRTEVTCYNCGGHLGHVFYGERFTKENTRHCVNSISLNFIEDSD